MAAEQFDPTFSTSSISHWADINTYLVDGIDREINASSDDEVKLQAVNLLSNDAADFTFLHFDDVDHAGHSYGFSPTVPQYTSALESVDHHIGDIIHAIHSRSTYAQENWLILISTDHGGNGTSHGGSSTEERTIFYIAAGPDAAKGEIQGPNWNLDGKVSGLNH